MFQKERWVLCEDRALPLNLYIEEYITAGPLPRTCWLFMTLTRTKHTGENEKAILLFRSEGKAKMYAEKTEHDKSLDLVECPLDKLLAARDLPVNTFVLDFDPLYEDDQVCTYIDVRDVDWPRNFTIFGYS